MVINRRLLLNRRTMRIVAVGLLAFPEPLLSGIFGLALFAASFVLPDRREDEGRASTCGCDFHRRAFPGRQVMGAGALVHVRRWIVPKVSTHARYELERYGFVPAGLPRVEPAGNLSNAAAASCSGYPVGWHTWPKLEGALLRRLGGFGTTAAVKCEWIRVASAAR